METKGKIIFLDWGMFIFKSIFAWRRNKEMFPEYICMNMILSCLRKIGVEPFDTIIIACDKGRSWRKEIDLAYKADRKEKRDAYEDIDWKIMFRKFDNLLDKINAGTDWHIVSAEHLEADDWMSAGARYYKDKEVILVTFDADMEQLAIYPNVKIFSPMIKVKGKKGGYKIIKNPYLVLSKKIQKETADNLEAVGITNEDYEKRKMIVSLLELPNYIENTCQETFNNLEEKENYNLEEVPFPSIKSKISGLYNDKSAIITYEDCIEYKEKKNKRKSKRAKARRKN